MPFEPYFIDLIRHGQPQGGDRFRGTQDDPLNELGWQQMRDSVAGMNGWEAIVTSPLKRCAEFAAELAQQHAIPLEVEPDLAELRFGEWEGKCYLELHEQDPEFLSAFFSDPFRHTPPGGEPLADFCVRIEGVWEAIKQRHAGKHILVICHGAVMRVIYRQVLNTPKESLFHIEVPYACLTRIRRHAEGDRLVFHRGPEAR